MNCYYTEKKQKQGHSRETRSLSKQYKCTLDKLECEKRIEGGEIRKKRVHIQGRESGLYIESGPPSTQHTNTLVSISGQYCKFLPILFEFIHCIIFSSIIFLSL